MGKQRRSIAIGDLVRIHPDWSADYRQLYAFNFKDYFYVWATYPLTKRSIVCVLMPGSIPCRRSHLKRPRMKKVERVALLAALQAKADALEFFSKDIPAEGGGVSDASSPVAHSAAGADGEPAITLPSNVGHAEPGGDEGPGSFINELASPFSPEEQGLADAINQGGPQWPQER